MNEPPTVIEQLDGLIGDCVIIRLLTEDQKMDDLMIDLISRFEQVKQIEDQK